MIDLPDGHEDNHNPDTLPLEIVTDIEEVLRNKKKKPFS